jgi:hypothetical protein
MFQLSDILQCKLIGDEEKMKRILCSVLCLAVVFSLLVLPELTAAAQSIWTQVNAEPNRPMSPVTALAEFKGSLYAATTQTDVTLPLSSVYRQTGDSHWVKVSPDAFGNPLNNQAIWNMVVFKGKLYVGTGWGFNWQTNDSSAYVSQIWRTSNGTTWEAVDTTGFGNPNNYLADKFTVYQGNIYAAIDQQDVNTAGGGIVPSLGVQLYRSASGNPGTWTKVTTIFDNPKYGYQDSTGFISYKGMLYWALEGPAELWRSTNGTDWTPVTQDAFGNPIPQRTGSGGLAIYKGQLYWGLNTKTNKGEIWRSDDGLHWTNVMQGGFGNPNNLKVEALIPYEDNLYAVVDNFKDGISVWKSADSTHWQQVSPYGFNGVCTLDPNRNGNCNMVTLNGSATVIFEDRLYVGVWNPVGGQIWRMNSGN